MGSALNSVMGGSGGGLLGAVGGIVGGMFGGPIGAMIGQAIGNMLQEAIGDALKDAVTQLQKEHGMPGFLAQLVHEKTDQIIGGLRNEVPADVQQHAQDQYGSVFSDFKKELSNALVENVRNQLKDGNGSEETGTGSAKGSGKSSGGSWMLAIARAMGEVMGKKAARMVELSQKIQALSDSQAQQGQQSDGDKMKAAAETQKLNTEFQATSQEFNLLQTTFSTTIKTLGEGMASIARKQ
jgi:hypothetical protein